MFIIKHTLKLLSTCWKRFVLFVCLTALLCIATGLLGSFLLSENSVAEPITVVVADLDDSMESRLFYNVLTSAEIYKEFLLFEKTDEDTARAMLENGSATAVVILPEGFARSVMSGENKSLSIAYSQDTPLKAQLVRTFADAFTDMLKTTQLGVYTVQEYTYEHGDAAQYEDMFLRSNMGYLTVVGNREMLFDTQLLSATGRADIFDYYLLQILVFLLFLSPVLLLDVLRPTFSPYVLNSLGRLRKGAGVIGAGSIAGIFCLYLCIGILATAVLCSFAESFLARAAGFFLALLPVLAVLSAFALLCVLLFRSTAAGGILLSVFSLASLFLAGGIIPTYYLAPWIRAIGYLTPQYWSVQLLLGGLSGTPDAAAPAAMAFFGTVFAAGAVYLLGMRRSGRLRNH